MAPEPRGHGEILEGLWRAARAGRLPHALLFQGRRGVGKYAVARWFALSLLCSSESALGDGPCGLCGPCKRAGSGSHTGLLVIDPVVENLRYLRLARFVERNLEDVHKEDRGCMPAEVFVGLKALEGAWRIVLVREMDRAKTPAQQSVLKILEEPYPGVLWILETSSPGALLPTIHSRCVPVRFQGLPVAESAAVLEEQGLEPADAARLSRWSRGSPGVAIELAARAAPAMRSLLVRLVEGELPVQAASAELWELEGEFPGTTPGNRARERARAFLDLAAAVVADLLRWRAGADPQALAHGDLPRERPRARLAEVRARRVLDDVLLARQEVDQNVAPEAAVDRALLALAAGSEPASHRGGGPRMLPGARR